MARRVSSLLALLACLSSALAERPLREREAAALSLTPFDVLQQNGLPVGLLPHAVTSFAIDASGNFEVHLATPCKAIVDIWGGLPLRYDSVLRGNIKGGKITKLQGVVAEASERLVWVNVATIAMSNVDNLEFLVTWGKLRFNVDIPTKVFAGDLVCVPEQRNVA